MPSGVRILHLPPRPDEFLREQQVREFFLALRRGITLGRCGSCETFYVMAKLCLEEGAASSLGEEERAEAASWVEAGSISEAGFGCDGACAVIPLYSRIAR